MKYFFVIARYKDGRQKIFDEVFSPRNKQYAEKHGYKYVEIRNEHKIDLVRGNPTWWKYSVLCDLITTERVQDGDIVLHLDADMYITDLEKSLEPAEDKSFAYSIDTGNTHCMGWYSIRINNWSKHLPFKILDEYRYQQLKDKISIHERFQTYSSFWNEFREQASWYSLASVKRHSDKSFWEYPDNGFHSVPEEQQDEFAYPLDVLQKHVHIFGSEYNVTEWPGESSCQFNINPVEKDKVVIRHFAGGQDWNNYKNWVK